MTDDLVGNRRRTYETYKAKLAIREEMYRKLQGSERTFKAANVECQLAWNDYIEKFPQVPLDAGGQ